MTERPGRSKILFNFKCFAIQSVSSLSRCDTVQTCWWIIVTFVLKVSWCLWQFLERFIVFEIPWWPLKMVLDFQTHCSLHRVKQKTTRARCTVTIQSLIDVQIKLQTRLYFIHYKLIEKIIFKPLKCPKMVFWGGGVGFGKFSYVKVGCVIPHSKGFGTHIILVTRVVNYCYPYFQNVKCKNVGALSIIYCFAYIP